MPKACLRHDIAAGVRICVRRRTGAPLSELCAEGPETYPGVLMLALLAMTSLAPMLPSAGTCTPGMPAA
jgi:hypothetical protein